MNLSHNKQIKSNILIVSADLPYIGGCGTNSYNLIKYLTKISRYNIFGLFITNIEGNENPDKLNNIFKLNITPNIEDQLNKLKININQDYGEIDLIIIKNYKSFVFINRTFKNENKLFISSGLRYFTNEIEKGFVATDLIKNNYNSLNFEFDIDLVDNNNIYDNVMKYDLFLEKYVYYKSTNVIANSELTKNILTLSNIKDVNVLNTTFINYESEYSLGNYKTFSENTYNILSNDELKDLLYLFKDSKNDNTNIYPIIKKNILLSLGFKINSNNRFENYKDWFNNLNQQIKSRLLNDNDQFLNFDFIQKLVTSYNNYLDDFVNREYDLVFVAYNLARKLKNYNLLLELIKSKKLDHLKILIIGINDGVEKVNKTNVTYLGYIENDKLILLIKKCKTLFCPSYYDSNPNVVCEAIMNDCNVIISRNCGNYNYINEELIVEDLNDHNECIKKIQNSILNIFHNKIIDNDQILTDLIKIIDKIIFKDTINLVYNCSNKGNEFCRHEMLKQYEVNDSMSELFINPIYPKKKFKYHKCFSHGDYPYQNCETCTRYLVYERNNLNLNHLEYQKSDMEVDESLNISNNNIYYLICLDLAKKNKYKVINYISYDGAAGCKELNNKSKMNSYYLDDIRVNIFFINDPKDIISFRHADYTFLRGYYNYLHGLFKEHRIFYSAACCELAETGEPVQFSGYNKILYHDVNDYNYYCNHSRKYPDSKMVKFNKFNFINNKVTNNREYDIGFIANGNGATKNIELFVSLLDFILENKKTLKILIICNNEIFLKYKDLSNVILLYNSEFHKRIDLSEYYPKIKFNIIMSIYDYCPRTLNESLSFGCFNILFKNIYSGSYLIRDNPEFGFLIDLQKYGLENVNKVKVENSYFDKFKLVWNDVLNILDNKNINHVAISANFNIKYNIQDKNRLIKDL